jgi:hypothetical protein
MGKCPKCGGVFKAEPRPIGEEIVVFPEELKAFPEAVEAFPEVPPSPRVAPRDSESEVAVFPTAPSDRPMPAVARAAPAAKTVPAPAPQPAFIAPAQSGARAIVHRRKSSPLPLLIGGGIGVLALLGFIGLLASGIFSGAEQVVDNQQSAEVPSANHSAPPPPVAPVTPATPPSPSIAELLPQPGSQTPPSPPHDLPANNQNPAAAPPSVDNPPTPAQPLNPLPQNPLPQNPLPENPPTSPEDPVVDLLARVDELRDSCDKLTWSPGDAQEYAQFQLLASHLTQAANIADAATSSAETKILLQAAIQKTLQALTAEKWPTDAAWQKTGELAEKALGTPGEGVFAVGRVILPTSAGNMVENQPTAVLQLVGSKQLVVVTAAQHAEQFTPDAQFLILGVHDPRVQIRVNRPEGEQLAAMVRTKYILAVEKQD